MNDGIYSPPDAGRMEKFQAGTRDFSKLSRASGARVVILTPPPFDPLSYKGTLAPDGFDDYGFKTPWQNYNQTLAAYSTWLRETKEDLADAIVDIHTPLTSVIAEWHKTDPKWSSGDGIHPIPAIHWIIAGLIAESLGIPDTVADLNAGQANAPGAWTLTFRAAPRWPPRSTPPPDSSPPAVSRKPPTASPHHPPHPRRRPARKIRRPAARHRHPQPTGPRPQPHPLPWLSLNRDASAALPLALERHRMLSNAWREHIGHTRPDTDRTALPLDQALAAAAKIEETLNTLLAPREESLQLKPVSSPSQNP